MFEHMSAWGWGWLGLGAIHMALFWGVIILLVVVLVKVLSGLGNDRGPGGGAEDDPLKILEQRFARGEIDEEEFERRRRRLRGG